MKKILLHTCCAPCLIYPGEFLAKDWAVTPFYFNPNIHPKEEYKLRLRTWRQYCRSQKYEYIIGDYTPARYYQLIKGWEHDQKQRCPRCYRVRLTETAQRAQRFGYPAFSTTLMVSPYQDLKMLEKIGQELAAKYNLQFISGTGWAEHFAEAQQRAKELGLYRQKYCGCRFSQGEVE